MANLIPNYDDAAASGSRLTTAVKTEIEVVANAGIHGATAKTTPVDADTVPIRDSEASNAPKRVTFANLKAWIKSWIAKDDVGLSNVTNNAQYYSGGTDVAVADGGTGVSTLTGLVKGNGTSAFTAAAAGTDYVAPGGALGTPASGTLTNCTGLPVAGIAASTSTAVGVGSINLGHASDTTITRSEAGLIAVEGIAVPTITGAKRIAVVSTLPGTPDADTVYVVNDAGAPRVTTITSSATPAINTDACDLVTITALAAAITSMSSGLTGTPTNGQRLLIRIKDNGTARAITWGASFVSSGSATLLATTVVSKAHLIGLIYDAVAAKWVCVAVDSTGY